MQQAGKVMYINFVKKDGQFKGNAFIRFSNSQDFDKLLALYEEIGKSPEKWSVLDPKQILQIGTRFLDIFKFKEISQEN